MSLDLEKAQIMYKLARGNGNWSANTGVYIASGLTVETGMIVSGSTDLYNIFSTPDTNDITRVQQGSNITTGGTGTAISVASHYGITVNNLCREDHKNYWEKLVKENK
jgi:hypothetical protein